MEAETTMGFLRGRPGFLLGTGATGREMGFGGEKVKADDEVIDVVGAETDSIMVEEAK